MLSISNLFFPFQIWEFNLILFFSFDLRMNVVKLNVGGTRFEAELSTLISFPDSVLAKMMTLDRRATLTSSSCSLCSGSDLMQNNVSLCGVSCPHCPEEARNVNTEEEVFLDCDPPSFAVVLNFLRYRTVVLPPSLSPELVSRVAVGLGLPELAALLQKSLENKEIEKETMMDWVKLNVGGRFFETTLATLTSHPGSSLAKMFEPNSKFSPATMDDGVYQLDACPRAFSVVLNWLRYRRVMMGPNTKPEEVVPVADFFGLNDLNLELKNYISKEEEKSGALVESLENCIEGLKEVLQEIQIGVEDRAEKLDEIKLEIANVGSSLEDIWRIKCELTNVTEAL